MNKKRRAVAERIALVGIMAAFIETAKLALAALPNIEAVTLLVAVFSYSFGTLGFIATTVFVAIEPLIWGFGTWFISYLIYWPALSLLFIFLRHTGVKRIIPITAAALIMTALFGVISSLVDVGIFSGSYENLPSRFIIYYTRGIPFYLAQLITNLVLFPVLFRPLTKRAAAIIKN